MMKTILSVVLTASLVGGCTRDVTASIPELGDRVLTVDEYLAQPDLRKKVSTICRNDPGRVGMTPNCVNVRRADHIASIGSASSLRIDMSD